jgi:SAM-dependent methyltransferase
MIDAHQDLDQVHQYYSVLRPAGAADRTIYEIWEDGGAFNDSVTPSTYNPEYREYMARKILGLAPAGARVFSFGCGNGFVEGDLVSSGLEVRAIDVNEEAVALTRRKGVDAFTADYYALQPSDVAGTDVVYADGFLGHLFDADEELRPVLGKLAELEPRSGTTLVFSNDSPVDGRAAFASHPAVEGFWFISKDHLSESLAEVGFEPMESYYFPYVRPVSGVRYRTICTARVP